ncbi:uncharacterized protein DS421_3g77610 [Arachis hypogaea]|nr:uncharacterized protein DS421_3g77610 [Arachis hypogaea]
MIHRKLLLNFRISSPEGLSSKHTTHKTQHTHKSSAAAEERKRREGGNGEGGEERRAGAGGPRHRCCHALPNRRCRSVEPPPSPSLPSLPLLSSKVEEATRQRREGGKVTASPSSSSPRRRRPHRVAVVVLTASPSSVGEAEDREKPTGECVRERGEAGSATAAAPSRRRVLRRRC